MSAYATSSPSIEQIRWYLIRPPSLACTCRNETSWDSGGGVELHGHADQPERHRTLPDRTHAHPSSVRTVHQCDRSSRAESIASRRMGACVPMLATRGAHVPPGRGGSTRSSGTACASSATARTGVRGSADRRNDNDVTVSFPELAGPLGGRDLLARRRGGRVQRRGLPDFRVLAERMHVRDAAPRGRGSRRAPGDVHGLRPAPSRRRDLTDEPWASGARSSSDLGRATRAGRCRRRYDDGQMLHEATAAQGLEGIVCKRLASPLPAGERSEDWLKFAAPPPAVVRGRRLAAGDGHRRTGSAPCSSGSRRRRA